MRNNVVKMARLKHELKAAPAYAYYFTWQTPILDGIPRAWHTADLQFCKPLCDRVWGQSAGVSDAKPIELYFGGGAAVARIA